MTTFYDRSMVKSKEEGLIKLAISKTLVRPHV